MLGRLVPLAALCAAMVGARIVGAAETPTTPPPPASADRAGVHLSWVRSEAAISCPDAAAVEGAVARRLDDDPFQRAPQLFIEAGVSREGGAYRVTITMRDATGASVGSRTITSTARSCGPIADAAALTIAILIDPDALLRPPASAPAGPPPPPPPETVTAPRVPVPPAPAAPDLAGRVSLLALGGKGFLPTLAVGAGLAATVDFAAHGAATLAVGFYPERSVSAVGGRFAFGLSYIELSGCFVARPGPVRWELCAGGSAGALTVVVYDPQPVAPGQRWYLGLAQLTRVVVPIFPAVLLEVGLEASEPVPRRSFFVEGGPPGMDTVFTQPYVAVAAWTGLGLRWR